MMVTMSKKTKTLSQLVVSLLYLYVFAATLAVIATSGVFIWPFIFFALISAHALLMALRSYGKDADKFLVWTSSVQAFLATIALFPSIVVLLADRIGPLCSDRLCSEDAFIILSVRTVVFVPMMLIAILSCHKNRKTHRLSQLPWEVIILAIGLIFVGTLFYRLGQSTSGLQDGLFPNW